MSGCPECRTLLGQGLDLCVRARKLDGQDRANLHVAASLDGENWEKSGKFKRFAESHNANRPDHAMATKSATVPIWIADQYETDLADWERRSRTHLMQCCTLIDEASK